MLTGIANNTVMIVFALFAAGLLAISDKLNSFSISTLVASGAGGGVICGVIFGVIVGKINVIQESTYVRANSVYVVAIYSCISMSIYMITALIVTQPPVGEWLGVQVFFVGLLTIVNAPFDWASIGLTRFLLRKSVKNGKWIMILIAVADVLCAIVLVFILMVCLIVNVEIFNYLTTLRGGIAILPLQELLNKIERNPGGSEYWWIYVLIVSGMTPSVINLMIGWASLIRGPVWVSKSFAADVAPGSKVSMRRLDSIKFWLSLQWTVGIGLGGVTAYMIWIAIGLSIPRYSGVVETARAVDIAVHNLLPMQQKSMGKAIR